MSGKSGYFKENTIDDTTDLQVYQEGDSDKYFSSKLIHNIMAVTVNHKQK